MAGIGQTSNPAISSTETITLQSTIQMHRGQFKKQGTVQEGEADLGQPLVVDCAGDWQHCYKAWTENTFMHYRQVYNNHWLVSSSTNVQQVMDAALP